MTRTCWGWWGGSTPPVRRWHWMGLAALCSPVSFAFPACVYDSSERCGEHQVYVREAGGVAVCVCDDQSASVGGVCVPCGEGEVVGPSGCECAPGSARGSENGPCVACGENEVAGESGCECAEGFERTSPEEPCEASSGDDAPGDDDAGGQNCESDADCNEGDACDLTASPAVCVVRPEGLGMSCTSNDDCAGTEATFCDMVVTKACTVSGCTLDPNDCFPGYTCCDLSSFGLAGLTLCSLGECVTL